MSLEIFSQLPFFLPSQKTFLLYNKYHLGDHIFNIILLNKITPYLKKNNLKVEYRCERGYHKQVGEFIMDGDVIYLRDMDSNGALEVWINNRDIMEYYELQMKIGFDSYYVYFFNRVMQKMRIPYVILDWKYEDEDLIRRRDRLYEMDEKYRNLDILIINSQPMSGQFVFKKKKWDQFITQLVHRKGYRVITTNKVKDVVCTMDEQLSVKDIAALSTKVRYIISINTGPFVGCYNEYTLKNVEKIYMFVERLYYDHPKIETYQEIDEIFRYFL